MAKSRLVPPVGLVAVAGLLRVICDDELTDEIVVPDGMPVPVTVWFASRPSVVVPGGKVTMVDPLVSVPVKRRPRRLPPRRARGRRLRIGGIPGANAFLEGDTEGLGGGVVDSC